MDRWQGRVAVVTGASGGIGAAVVEDLVDSGMVVVGLARREERLKEMKTKLQNKTGVFHYLKTDISKEEEVIAAFKWIKETLGGVDVLVNNAGATAFGLACEANIKDWRLMFDVNVFAIAACSRETLNSLKERELDNGHIININSVASHRVSNVLGVAPYSSSKFASKAITEGIRKELVAQKSKIKVTSISPGYVKTEMLDVIKDINTEFANTPQLEPKDIADAIHYVLASPPHVQVNEMIIRPVGEGY